MKPNPRRTVIAVMTLAHQRAKKAVLAQLRAKGLRPAKYPAVYIAVMSNVYYAQQMGPLFTEAVKDFMTWPGFARWLCKNHNTNAKAREPFSVTTISVQKS